MNDINDYCNKKLLTLKILQKKSGHREMTTLRDATNDTTPPFTYRLTGFVNSFS